MQHQPQNQIAPDALHFVVLPHGSAGPRKMAVLVRAARHHIECLRAGKTDREIQEWLGIGYRTWVKVRDEEPIRASVAERLIDRMGLQVSG